MGGRRTVALWLLATLAGLAACGDGSSSEEGSGSATSPAASGRCRVLLHGKGGGGAPTSIDDGVAVISPDGNAEGWGGRQWLYFPDDAHAEARAVVEAAIDGCDEVIVGGFSNGGAFAAKLYCRRETFDGRLVHVVVDDPVVDGGVEGCAPDASVGVTLYWTGALEAQAQPGWECSEADWTCEGGTTIGIDAFAAALGVSPLPSPFDEHQWYLDAPELSQWP